MSGLIELQTMSVRIPGGTVCIVVDPVDGAVISSGFADLDTVVGFLDARVRERGFRAPRTSVALGPVKAATSAYTDGDLAALDRVLVRQPGGPFLQRAWAELRGVPAGQTQSYAGLAALAGRPKAVRAAGQACARNRVAPYVPCHRILRSDGTLGGYAYGLPVKEALLRHEDVLLP